MMMAHRMALYENDKQPRLVASVTEDDEDEAGETYAPHNHLIHQVRSGSSTHKNRQALAYLLRYETMVRQQEAQDMATLAHLRPCMERIQVLAGMKAIQSSEDHCSSDLLLQQQVSLGQLAKAYQIIQNSKKLDTPEFMTTDRQLMMVLQVLTENLQEQDESVQMSWAEFAQAYKLCVAGMETLQHLPFDGDSTSRNRARNRTLSMLTLFEAGATRLFDGTPVTRVAANTKTTEPTATGDDNDALLQESISKGPAKVGFFKILVTLLLIIVSGLGASMKLELVSEGDIAKAMSVSQTMAYNAKDQVQNFLMKKMEQVESHSGGTVLEEYFTRPRSNDTKPSPMPISRLPSEPSVFNYNPNQISSGSIESYMGSSSVNVVDSSSNNNVAIPAIFGGIIGAAGAPYAGLILQKLMQILIASSTTQILLASFVAALVPMTVGGFLTRMSSYARHYELEFSIE